MYVKILSVSPSSPIPGFTMSLQVAHSFEPHIAIHKPCAIKVKAIENGIFNLL